MNQFEFSDYSDDDAQFEDSKEAFSESEQTVKACSTPAASKRQLESPENNIEQKIPKKKKVSKFYL